MLNVKERFVRRLIAERRISFLKLGKYVRIPEESIRDFENSSWVEKLN